LYKERNQQDVYGFLQWTLKENQYGVTSRHIEKDQNGEGCVVTKFQTWKWQVLALKTKINKTITQCSTLTMDNTRLESTMLSYEK
jgi:hypothetical protein